MADQLITGTTIIEDKRAETGLIWSCSGYNFFPTDLNANDWHEEARPGQAHITSVNQAAQAHVSLPNGTTVTGCLVDGNAALIANYTWSLKRITRSDGTTSTMATAAVGTTDTSITNAKIDNSTYAYVIQLDSPGNEAFLFGAKITYSR